jgi:predicted dehydrogenase
MALIREDCVEMVRAAKANDRLLMVGQVVRKDQLFLAAKKYIDAGEIGEIFAVESQYAHDYGDMQSDWRKNPKYPRHIIVGGGCHAIDMLRWIVGNPVEVFAYANHKVLDNYPVDDTTVAVIKFENGAIGRVFCSMAAKSGMGMYTVFYGSKGTLVAKGSELIFYKDEIVPGDKNYLDHKAQHMTVNIHIDRNTHNTLAEIQEFSDAILGITPLTVDGIEGASTVAVCDAIVRSAASGNKVAVDYDFFD